VRVIHPCLTEGFDVGDSSNDKSLVMILEHKRIRVALTGDVEARGEARLVDAIRGRRLHLLKVAHHGSRSSSTAGFLDVARPLAAVISCAPFSHRGIPHPSVLERLNAGGARVFRTDRHGAIRVESDGFALGVRPMNVPSAAGRRRF